jgi:hypothetical protein
LCQARIDAVLRGDHLLGTSLAAWQEGTQSESPSRKRVHQGSVGTLVFIVGFPGHFQN